MQKFFLLLLFALIFSGCNSDRFVNDIVPDKLSIKLDSRLTSDIINVAGDWHSITLYSEYYASFTIIDEYGNKTTKWGYDATLRGKGSLSLESEVRKITLNSIGNGRIVVSANYMMNPEQENFDIGIEGDVIIKHVPLSVEQTHKFEIEHVSYTLDIWETFPETYPQILTVTHYPPVNYNGIYSFSYIGVGQLESIGKIVNWSEEEVANAICDARQYYIPIPSSTGLPGDPWAMLGDEMLLTPGVCEVTFHQMPEQPVYEYLPGDCTPTLTLTATMERIGFDCLMTVYNPATDTRHNISGKLIIDMPVTIKGSYEY